MKFELADLFKLNLMGKTSCWNFPTEKGLVSWAIWLPVSCGIGMLIQIESTLHKSIGQQLN